MGKRETLAVVASKQHGPFTRRQALDAGFTPAEIRSKLESHSWMKLHRSVYCDVAVLASFERDASAAVLACGPLAAASHRTAALLWRLDVPRPEQPHITVLSPAHARPSGVRVHRTMRLHVTEAAPLDGIRVTSPGRTLLDLSADEDEKVLELALDRLWRRKLVEPRRLLAYLAGDWCVARRGSAALRALASQRVGQGPSGSDIETLFLQILRDARLPLPVRQYPVVTPCGPRYLDFAYAQERVAIEIDGMDSRLDPEVFLDERDRQNLIEAQGWTFRRFGHAHVRKDALWTVFSVAEALGRWPVRWTTAGYARRSGP
jgi:very-short-patch-repair endonuclease